jgi:hypothetical protein
MDYTSQEPAFRGGSWFLQPGVDGRVKPDHDKVCEIAGNSKPDSRGTNPAMTKVLKMQEDPNRTAG